MTVDENCGEGKKIELISVKDALGVCPETGIAGDYANSFSMMKYIGGDWKSMFDNEKEALEYIKQKPIKKYLEHIEAKERQYSECAGKPKKFSDAVTPKNEENIKKLDELIDQINATIACANSIGEIAEMCKPLFEEIGTRIYGKESHWRHQFKI